MFTGWFSRVKCNVVSVYAMKAKKGRESGGKYPRFLNDGIRYRWEVKFHVRCLFVRVWVGPTACLKVLEIKEKNILSHVVNRTPDLPARSLVTIASSVQTPKYLSFLIYWSQLMIEEYTAIIKKIQNITQKNLWQSNRTHQTALFRPGSLRTKKNTYMK
jgi:hypothetical protein